MKIKQQQAGDAKSWGLGVTLGLLLGVGLLIAAPRLATPKAAAAEAGAAPAVNTTQQEPTLPQGSTATKAEVTPPADAKAASAPKAADGAGDSGVGKTVYASNCAGCHGADAQGGAGPALAPTAAWSAEEFKAAVREGKAPERQLAPMMPKFDAKTLDDAKMNDLYAFIKSL